jgi:hypothetical protein
MKKINKDYISVVRNVNRRLQFERIPMQKSVKALDKLYKMSEEDNYTVSDMESYIRDLPVFKFIALPYYHAVDVMDFDSPEDWAMQELVKDLKSAKTKVRLFEKAVALIEECDYRWNIIRIINTLPDVLIYSHPGYDSTYLDLKLPNDMSILFEANDLDSNFGGNLYYVVYKGDTPVLPYRSVVEMYACCDDVLDATKVFDPEPSQWDNALKSYVATVNAILDDHEAYLKSHVIEAGQEMLEMIKLMSLDAEAYYRWIENNENVSVDYSEGERTLDSLNDKEGQDRRLYELYVMGDKMMQALIMAENLHVWSGEGLEYNGLTNVLEDIKCLATVLLQEMESIHDSIPEEVFSEDYGEYNAIERQRHTIATDLRSTCEKLRLLLNFQERYPNLAND